MTRAIRKHLADFIALTVLFAIGIGVTGYIISQQESRPYIPFLEKSPFKLKAEGKVTGSGVKSVWKAS